MCKLQEPPFEMDIVVSFNMEDIMALAPKPKEKKEKRVKMRSEKKSKKQKKTSGLDVMETLEENNQVNTEEQHVGYTTQEIEMQTGNEFKFPYEKPSSLAATDNAGLEICLEISRCCSKSILMKVSDIIIYIMKIM